MFRIFKFALLILTSLTSLYSFDLGSVDDATFTYYRLTGYTPSYFNGEKNPQFSSISFSRLNSDHVKIGNDVYKISNTSYQVFNTTLLNSSGSFLYISKNDSKYLLNYDNNPKRSVSCIPDTLNPQMKYVDCGEKNNGNPKAIQVDFSYFEYHRLLKVTTCQPDEHFNTQTKQCQKCPDGQKWDQKRNMCWKDCTNIDKNMYGFFDYSVSGRCVDCSNSKTAREILECFCSSSGHGVPPPGPHVDTGYPNSDPCVFSGKCQDGFGFYYTDPECKKPKDPKPDDNNTKPKPNDNNSTKPNDSGNSGNSGGGNSGNSGSDNNGQENNNNNDDSGGGGPGGSEFCKKNPNHESCKENENDKFCKENPNDPKCKPGKPGGDGNTTNNFFGGGGGGGNGDDEKAVFNEGDFKYGDVEKKYEELKAKFEYADKTYLDEYKKFESGIKQFIENVKGNGLSRFDKGSTLNNCPKSYSIPIINKTEKIEFDICEIFKPMRNTFYYVAYASFFLSFLILTIKLMIFSF